MLEPVGCKATSLLQISPVAQETAVYGRFASQPTSMALSPVS